MYLRRINNTDPRMKKFTLLFLTLVFSSQLYSQKWAEMIQDPNSNFYDIQQEFNAYWSQPEKKKLLDEMQNERNEKHKSFSVEEEKEVAGWVQFKRWEWLHEPLAYPTGNLLPPADYFEALERKNNETTFAGSWTAMGPTGQITTPILLSGGAGRVCCVRFDPSNSNIVYIGAPGGGLWKSTNGGNGWTMWNTDGLGSLGISDVAVDPTNSQVIYIGSGDADAGDTYGLGVLKSTDGGVTWNPTGLSWTTSQGRTVSKILIDPTNTQIIHVATSNGIYRSTNGGTTFTLVSSAGPHDMEMKPNDPSTIYAAVGASVYRSTNSGQSYSSIYSVSGAGRLALAVTLADSNYLYVLADKSSDGSFQGFYRSTDGGNSFSAKSTSPNILGRASDGSDAGVGQGWYDLCVAASPIHADEVVIGGINIWRSTDGGTTWTINAQWQGSGAPYVHADIHDLIYLDSATVFTGNDGGIFRTQNNGGSWTDMSNGLEIGEMYRLGQSSTSGAWLFTGLQDNGTDRLNGTIWTHPLGGDGMECFVDRTNNNTVYGEQYNGAFNRSTNGGSNWTSIISGMSGTAGWVTPWMQDPVSVLTLWSGYQDVFKSTNQGTSWTKMSSIGGNPIVGIDVCASNNQVIYAAYPSALYKSTNGGTSWSGITSGLPVSSAQITYIKVNPKDANTLWVTFSGYSSGNKVFVTTNGGTSWANLSTGIPNLPVNCIEFEKNSVTKTLYCGTDVGVYYRDTTMSAWASFSQGLPNVKVDELEIQYTVSKIRAATYGRGMWESPLYVPTGISSPSVCEDDCITVFPNPNEGKFILQISELKNMKMPSIEIYNVMGEKNFNTTIQQYNNSAIEIDLRNFGKGIYFMQMKNENSTWQKKIIVM